MFVHGFYPWIEILSSLTEENQCSVILRNMIVVLLSTISLFTRDWEQYWSFYLETDEYPTIVTLSNFSIF